LVLADVHKAREAWQDLRAAATEGMAAAGPADWRHRVLLAHRGRALLELEQFAELEADIALLANGRGIAPRHAEALRALMLLRSGQHEEALRLARERLEGEQGLYRAVFRAVRFEAAHLLGRPAEAGALSAYDLGALRRTNHGAWVDRLVATYGLEEARSAASGALPWSPFMPGENTGLGL
jgi:hypothetical protein